MKYLSSLFCLGLILGCSAQVKKLSTNTYEATPDDVEVLVITKRPSIRSEDVCEVKLEVMKGIGYHGLLKKEARKCGGNVALVLNEEANDKNMVMVTATIIKTFTDSERITEEQFQKMELALKHNNVDSIKEILLKSQVSKDALFRHQRDNGDLYAILLLELVNGSNCNQQTVQLLQKEYQVRLPVFYLNDVLNRPGTYYKKDYSEYEQASLYCKGYVENNFAIFEDRDKIALKFVDHYNKLLREYNSPTELLAKLSSLNRVFGLIASDVRNACQKDTMSDLCIMRASFATIERELRTIFGELAKNGNLKSNSKDRKGLEDEIKKFEKTYKTFKI